MFELHCHCLVTVNCCHLYICGVVHVNSTKEVGSPEACSQIKTNISFYLKMANEIDTVL